MANIIISCGAGLFIIFLAIFLPIYLVRIKKEKVIYAEFYKNLNIKSFYTKLDNVTYTDKTGQKIKIFQVDNEGFRAGPIDIAWSDYNIKADEYHINGIKLMSLVFVSKKNTDSFCLVPTWKNFYIVKNYCCQEIENIDRMEKYVEQTSYINKL